MIATATLDAPARCTQVNACEELLEQIAEHLGEQSPVKVVADQNTGKKTARHELICTRRELMESIGIDPSTSVTRSFVQVINAKGGAYDLFVECITPLDEIMGQGVDPQYRITRYTYSSDEASGE